MSSRSTPPMTDRSSGRSRRAVTTRSTGRSPWPPIATAEGPSRPTNEPRSWIVSRRRWANGWMSSPGASPRSRPSRSRRRLVEAAPRRRHHPLLRRRGPHAHRRDGARSTPARPASGKLGFVKRVPIGVVGAISPFNFPLNLVCHKIAPGGRGRLSGRAQAGVRHSPHRAAHRRAVRGVRAAAGLAQRRHLPRARSANHLVEHDDVAMITFTGSPTSAGASGPGSARKRVGLELGNNAPVIIEPDGDVDGAAAKIAIGGYSFAGQSCISVQRVLRRTRSVHDGSSTPWRPRSPTLMVGDPADPDTDVSLADHGQGDRAGRSRGSTRRSTAAPRSWSGGDLGDQGVLRPTVARRGHARHGGDAAPRCSGRSSASPPTTTSTRPSTSPTTPATACRPASSRPSLGDRAGGGRRLDFGGVLVNEVPTWRADQMPYGGVRDSGNTREGPPYTVAGDDRTPADRAPGLTVPLPLPLPRHQRPTTGSRRRRNGGLADSRHQRPVTGSRRRRNRGGSV